MNCEQRQDLIPLLALGALDPEEVRELRAHLSTGCPACEGRLAEADAVLSMLPLSLPAVVPPVRVKDRLMERVRAGQPSTHTVVAGHPNAWKIGPALMGLAAGVVIAAGIFSLKLTAERNSVQTLRAQLTQKDLRIGEQDGLIRELKTDVLTMHDAVQTINSPNVQMVKLDGAPPQPDALAHVFVDRHDRMLLFCGDKIKALSPDKTYELWLVSGDKKIPVGMFAPDKNGEVAMITKIPAGVGLLAMAAVTDEPLGGMPQPTGHYQLLGKAAN